MKKGVIIIVIIVLIMVSGVTGIFLLMGKDRFVNEVETLFLKGHDPRDNFCYYLDLEGNQMPIGWKLSDFGYDTNNLQNSEVKHLGVINNRGIQRNSCDKWETLDGTKYASVIKACMGQDYASGKGIIYTREYVYCENECDEATGFCK